MSQILKFRNCVACVSLSLISFFATVQAASAEGVCAAVFPCDGGNVVAPFDTGDCAQLYRAQCLAAHVRDSESVCLSELNDMNQESKKMKRRIRALKRQVRKHKSSH